MNRIALGTAQFGLSYGVSNRRGQSSFDEIGRILDVARASGVDTLDTAVAYGDSESNLGAVGVADWKVVTKLPAMPEGTASVEQWVREMVAGSLERLRLARLQGLLLHRPQDLRGPGAEDLARVLKALKSEGLIRKIGLSVYGPEELMSLPDSFEPDIVQMPFNILDRRLIRGGLLQDLKGKGVEVHVRSIFLQGLLLMEPGSRPHYFKRWEAVWKAWESWISDTGTDPLAACLNFALAHRDIDRVVVGIESVEQLSQILEAAHSQSPVWPADLQSEDPDLIYPTRWKIK